MGTAIKAKKDKVKRLTLEDAVEIAQIGIQFGAIIQNAKTHPLPMNNPKLNALLERMVPYRTIFEPCVEASKKMLREYYPLPQQYGKDRLDYNIPEKK